MKKIILFGATGQLGKAIAKELAGRGCQFTIVVRSREKALMLSDYTDQFILADVTDPATIEDSTKGFDVVISALGKSVSPFERSKPSFRTIDLHGNLLILRDALKHGVKKFVYISAFHAEKYEELEYFKVHQEFSDQLASSGIDYSIIRPPALFSAFLDMIILARKGYLTNLGSGEKKTNPIYEGDLARICIDSIEMSNVVVDAGGQHVYSRRELNEIVQRIVDPKKKIRQIPAGLIRSMLPLVRLFDRNSFDKMIFFLKVMEEDVLAPRLGEMKFEDYIAAKAGN
ncbi:MAG TPA: NAD(P)H-binding protein [Chitinophagaceae bacterium]|nr:NAD(P)H-binding protein [Chitinophagaceae bacterium]